MKKWHLMFLDSKQRIRTTGHLGTGGYIPWLAQDRGARRRSLDGGPDIEIKRDRPRPGDCDRPDYFSPVAYFSSGHMPR